MAYDDNAPAARRRCITLFGIFGIGNLGNECTLWVTLHHLRRRLPGCDVTCVSDAVPDFARDYGVRPLPLDPFKVRGIHRFPTRLLRHIYAAIANLVTEPVRYRRTHFLIANTDHLIVVGTGALDDLGQLPWQLPAWVLRWCLAAKSTGAKVQLLAVGAGPIRHRISRYLMSRAVATADVRTYRDDYSCDYMRNLGIGSSHDTIVPDLVFALPVEWLGSWRCAASPPTVIGIGLMEYFGWNIGGDEGRRIYNGYILKMTEFVDWLITSGYRVRLLIGERHTDDNAVRDLLRSLGAATVAAAGERLAAPRIDSVHDLMREIMFTDLVVATRFHNLILALAAKRPVISIGYAPKFESLMREMQLTNYCQRFETLDLDQLKTQFQELTLEHATAVTAVSTKAEEYRGLLEQLFDTTFLPGDPGAHST